MNERDPERLRILGATDLEQRLLAAAAAETPSPELTRRMARGLGLAAGAGLTATSSTAAATPAGAAGGSGLVWPLVSAGVAALAVAGAVIGWSGTHRPVHGPPPVRTETPAAPAATPAAPALQPAPAAPHPRRHHLAPAPVAGDLRAEIALLDAARAAAAGGDDARALALLQRYDATFPAGTFRPESTALQVEALAHLGRAERARVLGRSFIAAHPNSPLVDRVRRALRASEPASH